MTLKEKYSFNHSILSLNIHTIILSDIIIFYENI